MIREYINGCLCKETVMYCNGNKDKEQYYNKNGYYHREGTSFNETNAKPKEGFWYKDGAGPAVTKWYFNGNKEYEKWYINSHLHREDDPAVTCWYRSGNRRYENWYNKNVLTNWYVYSDVTSTRCL